MKYTVLLFCCALIAARPSTDPPPSPAASPYARPSKSPINDTLPQALADRKAAFGFFDSVFAHPSYTFIKLEPRLPEGMDTILLRFNTAIAANRQWFDTYKDK